MIELIEQHRQELETLCRKHQVKTLEVFGSATDGTFESSTSDVDFLVDFLPLQPADHADAYFGLLFAPEDLFHRKIDLVEIPAIRNPYFMNSINQNRQVFYAA